MCEICRQNPCHSRCPNYTPSKAIHYCSICGVGIFDGEEYIENQDGEHRHYDCLLGMRELVEWFGYKVKIMEDEYD